MLKEEFTIIKTRKGKETEVTGDLEFLTGYFAYTLEAGHSYNNKIPVKPKSAKGLVSALNRATSELQRGSYDPNYYELKD